MPFPRWLLARRDRQKVTRLVLLCTVIVVLIHLMWRASPAGSPDVQIQYRFADSARDTGAAQHERLLAVKNEFLHAWSGYKEHAWLSDNLKPLTGQGENQFCGWAATLIDSLDTLHIMGLEKEFEYAVEAALKIDFLASTATCQINFFESTIRYLGGLLATYDLSNDRRLLAKLQELGDILYSAFNTTTGMPCGHCDLGRGKHKEMTVPDHDMPLADAFSFSVEFARLSQVTGDQKYIDKVFAISAVYQDAQVKSSLPGMWPERVDLSVDTAVPSQLVASSTKYSLGALSDSAYEYLVKMHLLIGRHDDRFGAMWQMAASAIKQNFLFRAYMPQWNNSNAIFTGIVTKSFQAAEADLEARTEHLACFSGGLFALSSRLFGDTQDLLLGEALTNGCAWAYDTSPSGIMPETVTLVPCPRPYETQCEWNVTLWDQVPGKASGYPHGYHSSIDTHYGLRPEAIESLFVLYRITGDSRWREVGWKIFSSIIAQTRTRYGHAALINVLHLHDSTSLDENVANNTAHILHHIAHQKDQMESFWLAETLKYFYLLFSDHDVISLDDFVLNTEAHPLRLTKGARV